MRHGKLIGYLVWSKKYLGWFLYLFIGCVELTSHIVYAQTGDCSSPQNLALNQPSEQSSTYGLGVSSLAVDGNQTGTSPWSANLQHSRNESQPWWQVDLGQLSQLESIRIVNRTDAYQNRLSNLYVFVSSTNFSGTRTLEELLADADITHFYIRDPIRNLFNLSLGVQGQYVRIQLAERGVLHMAEVEIYGCLSEDDPCFGANPVVIDAVGPFFENEVIQSLTANPAGGTWGGSVGEDGTFDPSIGPGTYGVSYTYTDVRGCTQSDSLEVPVIPLGKCDAPMNIALNQEVKQSSTLGNGVASLAVNGSRSGSSPWTGDLQHTEEEEEPWWEVELASYSQIDQVILFNRSDCCQSRLKDFYVLVSASPFNPEASLGDLLNNPNIEKRYFEGPAQSTEIIPMDLSGRYLRIQLSGTGTLHLREVEVIGCEGGTDPCQDAQPVVISPVATLAENEGIQNLTVTPSGGFWGGAATSIGTFDPSIGPGTYEVSYTYTDENGCYQIGVENLSVIPEGSTCRSPKNLALGQSAEQSSTYGLGIASVAVDGNTSGSGGPWEGAEIMHTEREDQPWWQIDLSQEAEIHEIILFNRTDCCKDRLSDFYVFLSDEPFSPDLSLLQLLDSDSISSFLFEGPVGDFTRVPIYSEGRYVRIQLSSANDILHMAEVEVWGCTGTGGDSGNNPFEGVGGSLEGPDEQEKPLLQIYPNPIASNEAINAQVKLPELGTYQISLYDYQGKISYRKIQKLERDEKISLPVKNLSQGIYLVEVWGERIHLTEKAWIK